jgi:CRISPR-associated protein Csb2
MGYRVKQPAVPADEHATVFDPDLLVLRLECETTGRRLGLESTLQVAAALRQRLLDASGNRVPEWISGKGPDGAKSTSPHVAFIPLAHVGRQHADGHLLGMAIALPRGIASDELRQFLGAFLLDDQDVMPKLIRLELGELVGTWTLQLDDRDGLARPQTLRPETWTAAACTWATVTPLVLDRHVKTLEETAEIIAVACERVTAVDGRPGIRPKCIDVKPVSRFEGVGHARRDFPALPDKFGKSVRSHTHVVITFAEPVRGPLLLGTGRYLGYGLCRPFRLEE